MDREKKIELLYLAKSLASDIDRENCGNFIPKVINAIKISKEYNDINKFNKVLENLQKTSFGGKNQKNGYCNFVKKTLRKEEYKSIYSLNFEELEYIFSWVRRLIKENKENNKKC